MYIRAAAGISPRSSFEQILTDPVPVTGSRLQCMEPDYAKLIDPKMIRRMSRIIKMGVAAAMQCLEEAGEKMPDAIITGTAYGCLGDTEVFLQKMVENDEQLLTPTAFIQSTHNTVAAQIALLLKCHSYNNTFVHRGFSFENAMTDALTLLKEGQMKTVLAGGIDEITDTSHTILQRFGLYKKEPFPAGNIFQTGSKGTIAGEGASFFVLQPGASGNDYAQLRGMDTFYKPASAEEIRQHISAFLERQNIDSAEIDLVISGENGDMKNDAVYDMVYQTVLSGITHIPFKHLSGEYPTASAFALWLAANILKTGKLPDGIQSKKSPSTVLIYNHYQHIYHSLYLLAAC